MVTSPKGQLPNSTASCTWAAGRTAAGTSHEALQALPKDKRGPEQLRARFIELIGQLYKVGADARRDKLAAQALQQRRAQHSKPVLERIEILALQHLHGVLPGSLLGKALHYITAQWPKLVRCRRRAIPDRQQRLCERDTSVRRRAPQLALRRHGDRRQRQREPVLAAADLPGQRDRWLPLPQCAAGCVTQDQTVEHFEALLPWRVATAERSSAASTRRKGAVH